MDKESVSKIKHWAEVSREVDQLCAEIKKIYPFEDVSYFYFTAIHENCKVEDGRLYSANGTLLCNDGRCMDEDVPYFVDQSCGYCEDDYYGTMFIMVDEINTFIEVHYEC